MDKQFVITTRNARLKQSFYQRTDPTAPLTVRQFVVGMVQHPNTSLFQVLVSTNGLDIISVSARRRIIDAEADIQAVKAILGSQDIYDERKVEAFFSQLAAESDEEPHPLPDELARQICREIVRVASHQPQ